MQMRLRTKRLVLCAVFVALGVGLQIHTIYSLGKNTGTGGLSHPPRPCEQVCLCQLVIGNRIAQGGRNRQLSHHRIETGRSVLSC